MIFDTHLHLIDRARLSYPWLGDVPALNRDWLFAEYRAAAARLGITACLHMEVDVAEADIDAETALVRAWMAEEGSPMLGAISAARPESAGFSAWLERADRSVIKGVRRVLHVVDDALSQSDVFRANIRALGAAGLPFDICVLQRQMPLAIALADACPNTALVLDHCGVPSIAAGGFDAWAAQMSALAKRPHVALKLSGITAYARPNWTLDDLRPYVDHALATFGPSRIVWGSDSPVCTLQSSLEGWVAATHALLAPLSSSEKDAILNANARQIWNLPRA